MAKLLCAIGAVLVVAACRPSQVSPQADIPAGELMDPGVSYEYAVYYLPAPTTDPLAALRDVVNGGEFNTVLVEDVPDSTDTPAVLGKIVDNVRELYAPPDEEALQYFGRGLSQKDPVRLQNSEQVLVLLFGSPKEQVLETLRSASTIAEAVARRTGGLIWDAETREMFTPDAWRETRVDSWRGRVPKLSKHMTIHAYQTGEFARAVTLGMAKFGLPDVVVEDFAFSQQTEMAILINLFCQAVTENPVVKEAGQFDLHLSLIENDEVREPQTKALGPEATGVALLTLKEGVPDEGDPENRLIELGFDRCPGPDVHAKQASLLSIFFGEGEDSTNMKYVQHDDEALTAASERARAKLPELCQAFNAGLDPGEYIAVKGPFETSDDGTEWMWVEVTAWDGEEISGVLNNEPFHIPDLHAGQVVKVRQQDVFDYIRYYADGREEGNETGEILQKMQG